MLQRCEHVTQRLEQCQDSKLCQQDLAAVLLVQRANPNPLVLPDWIPAFQTGLAEVVFTTITYALPPGLIKVASVATREFYDSPGLSLMNRAVFKQPSKEHQDALNRATAGHTAAKSRSKVRGFENTLSGMHEKAGGQAVTLTPEQRAEWRRAMAPMFRKSSKKQAARLSVSLPPWKLAAKPVPSRQGCP